jgi:nicotinamidase/pyrazinamidase
MSYQFNGAATASKVRAVNHIYKGIETPLDLYDALSSVWCEYTCAPRLRSRWSPENNTCGQCAITAFLAQDIFGGDVYGITTKEGGIHCYNAVNGITFDLTSEQFGYEAEELNYADPDNKKQERESAYHFFKDEKRARYEYLRHHLSAKRALIVVDMQNDFITGSLGTKDAVAIVPNVVQKIKRAADFGIDVIFTRDTHHENYLSTNEGLHLPVEHCIENTDGWKIADELSQYEADAVKIFDKPSFGSTALAGFIASEKYGDVELVGLCTDICVVSNALLIKANCPEITVHVDSSCCAGVTKKSHLAALATMKMCQVEITASRQGANT